MSHTVLVTSMNQPVLPPGALDLLDLPRLFDQLLDDAPVGMALLDANGRCLRSTGDRIGQLPSAVLGAIGAIVERRVASVIKTGEQIHEDDFEMPDGSQSCWTLHWYPVHDNDGQPRAVLVVAVDRSMSRRAERELERTEQRYRTMVEASATDVWRTDGTGSLLDDMPGWRAVTGQSESEVLGYGWLEGIHPHDRLRVAATWDGAVRTRSPYEAEFRIGRAYGPCRTVLVRGLPILSNGRVLEWVGTTVDVTAYRAAERAQQQAFSHAQAAALTLQHSLLPEQTWQPEVVDVCARYVAGVEDTEVGGDWYDVIELGAGRVGLVIGDVMGRGIQAAAVMGQLRTAVRAYSRLDLDPAELMGQLDGLVAEQDDSQIVTCVYAVYDPSQATLHIVNAGHVPPLLVLPDGSTQSLSCSVGPPLGAGTGVYDATSLAVEPGSLLALYTDGLVESRTEDIDVGIDRLADVLAAPWPGLSERCEGVLDTLGRATGSGDDVALLLVSFPRATEVRTSTLTLQVPRELESVQATRHASATRLGEWRLDVDIIDSALLVLNEMVTNAVTHGRGHVDLVLRRTPRWLYVEVLDASRLLPRRRLADGDDEDGRGLQMVAMLSERWGVRPTAVGKSVWAQIALPDPISARAS